MVRPLQRLPFTNDRRYEIHGGQPALDERAGWVRTPPPNARPPRRCPRPPHPNKSRSDCKFCWASKRISWPRAKLILGIKAVSIILPIHAGQRRTYLRIKPIHVCPPPELHHAKSDGSPLAHPSCSVRRSRPLLLRDPRVLRANSVLKKTGRGSHRSWRGAGTARQSQPRQQLSRPERKKFHHPQFPA